MEERKRKTKEICPREDRLEAEVIEGAQTYMEITEGRLAEVQIDENHLMELILSPYNMNRAYRKVVSNGGSGGVDSMEAKDLLPYLKLHLKVNLDKTEVGYVRGMKYLGHTFYKTGEG